MATDTSTDTATDTATDTTTETATDTATGVTFYCTMTNIGRYFLAKIIPTSNIDTIAPKNLDTKNKNSLLCKDLGVVYLALWENPPRIQSVYILQ